MLMSDSLDAPSGPPAMLASSGPHATLPEAVRAWALRTPGAEVAVLGSSRWTYSELVRRVDRLSSALRIAGIKSGDRVAALQTPHPDYLVSMLATLDAGALWVGLNPRYRVEELLHVIRDCTPRLLFTRTRVGKRDYAADLAQVLDVCPDLSPPVVFDGEPPLQGGRSMAEFLLAGEVEPVPNGSPERPDPSESGLIVYTSGSTGVPKGAMLSQAGVMAFASAQNRLWPVSPLRVLNYFPINHVGCVCDVTAPALEAGGCIVFLEQYDTAESLRLMGSERITLWASVPSVFQMQLASPAFTSADLSAVQLGVWEGAAMSRELVERLLELCPALATNYGMTETTSAIAALPPTRNLDQLAHSVGPMFPGVEVRLRSSQDGPVALGDPGEVQVRSVQVMRGYWEQPQATAAAFSEDGWFRTGDLAVQRPDGAYSIVGRLKEMYKSGGYNVYPREVETALEAHPAVEAAAVVGAPDPLWDEVGVAYVTTSTTVAAGELEAWCRARLANYKIPKRFHLEPELPLLPIGTVDKAALRRRAAEETVAS